MNETLLCWDVDNYWLSIKLSRLSHITFCLKEFDDIIVYDSMDISHDIETRK